MDLALSGLASGFDWLTLVDQLTELERAPQKRLASEQTKIEERNQAYGTLVTELGLLRNRIEAITEGTLFDTRQTSVGDDDIATATATEEAANGSYSFSFTQLATAARQVGASNIGASLNATNDVSALVLSDAAFATAVTAGTFTVNGKQITLETSDTLQEVFDKISTATGGTVTASYDSGTDTITLNGSGAIVLGSAADTSNFLQVARLYNNGTNSVVSDSALGAIRAGVELDNANFGVAISDGGSGAGEFTINGVSITFSASADSLANVIARINASAAGVTASYDSVNDRVVLSNKSTGDLGIAIEDVTGNFLAATGLSGGALERGNNLLYNVNGGGTLVSLSNTVTGESSGLAGLSVTALAEDTTTVEVASDTATIKTAIEDFVEQYNKVQSLINTQTSSTTDAKGKVTAGVLAGDRDVNDVASQLRSLVFSEVSGLSGTLSRLSALGYDTNGADDLLTLKDPDTLDQVLANDLARVKDLFTDEEDGIAIRLDEYLESVAGDEGSLIEHQDLLSEQSADIDGQIEELERIVQSNRERMIESFVAMEQAQAQINQQLQFLMQRFGSSAS